jgi:nitric oxide reductase activation protein
MIRDAVLLLGETLSIADELFSISGFCSNGRHEVYVNHFKNFNESFEQSKARLSTVRGQYSTRLGAAIRNTADYLAQQPSKMKLLLVVTDGEPSDIDVFDRHYLDHDSWHAVHSLANQGIKPFCLNLDSRSDQVMEHIFGRGKYMTLDQLHHLPEILFQVYMRYGRH